MVFQTYFYNRKWKNVSQDISFLDRVKWFLVGGYRFYDSPKLRKDGRRILAESAPPIWERLYYCFFGIRECKEKE
ncbi:MAG: hypothetical protein KAW92_11820 [Candidatus Cloacimonetes bacterium]|nr:hypothetical protein [Candidatus Cloacimonadota bacterium]